MGVGGVGGWVHAHVCVCVRQRIHIHIHTHTSTSATWSLEELRRSSLKHFILRASAIEMLGARRSASSKLYLDTNSQMSVP